MPSFPLIFVWFALMCGYLPYSMGYAFLNPLILISYGLLGLLIGANVTNPRNAITASAATTLLAITTVNVTSGIPRLVLPSVSILAASLALSTTSILATTGLRQRWTRQGHDESKIRLRLRLAFAALALALYFNSYLPYAWKMWLAARTTNPDLIQFAVITSVLLTATWFFTSHTTNKT